MAVLLGLAMLALFAAGFGLSRWIGSSGSTNAGPEPAPCVTVTVTPGASLPTPPKVTVNVYNSTKKAGLAGRTAVQVKQRGFVVAGVANDPKGTVVQGVAEIRHGASGLPGAQLLAAYVPGAKLVATDSTKPTVELALGPDFTTLLTTKEAQAVLASPSPSASGAGCASPSAAAAAS